MIRIETREVITSSGAMDECTALGFVSRHRTDALSGLCRMLVAAGHSGAAVTVTQQGIEALRIRDIGRLAKRSLGWSDQGGLRWGKYAPHPFAQGGAPGPLGASEVGVPAPGAEKPLATLPHSVSGHVGGGDAHAR